MANPHMEMGGLYGSSKYKQLDVLPDHLKPKTLLFEKGTSIEKVLEKMFLSYINCPFIIKPDRAERGIGVKLITKLAELENSTPILQADYIIQEYVDYPLRPGCFFTECLMKKRRDPLIGH
ncbi:MAG: hypothetical protein WD426_10185 [Anditalea sp.]